MKNFKIVNSIKNITLIIAGILFLWLILTIDSLSILNIIVLFVVASLFVGIGMLTERFIIMNFRNVKYHPIFTFNEVLDKNDVLMLYHDWLRDNNIEDTDDNFDYFYNNTVL